MNESQPPSVPSNDSAKPAEPTPTPIPTPTTVSAPASAPAQAPADAAASPSASASGGSESGGSESSASQSGGGPPAAGDRGARPSASGPSDGGDSHGGAADGEGGEGDGQKRRRRRRRRRKAALGEGGQAEGSTTAGADGEGAAAGGAAAADGGSPRSARPKRERAPREGKNRGQQHQPGDRRRGGKDSQHSATIAVRALADMAHALLRVEGVDPLAMPRYLDLNLRVPLDGGNDVRHAAGTAVEQILQRVREVREHEKALRPGAVYSYFADSSHAEGCRPIEPRHVFDGYSSTGKPKFADFVTLAIERKDPNIERMLAGEEIVLTHVTLGRVLRTQQLAEFGNASPVFKILGQVDAGLFRVLGEAGRCAFSFQLLRGTTLEGRVRLRLHPVGAIEPMDLADPALMQILSRFQRHLDTEAMRLEGQLKNGEVDEEQFVLPLLQDFAKQLQGRTRNTGRRTQHGLERSEEGQRPTSKAYPDAGEASDSSILWDVDQSTIVVLGAKGRAHVFTQQGKHVTSVVMQGAAIERRRHQGRWRLAEPEERGEFRLQIKRMIAAGEDQPRDQIDRPPSDRPPIEKPPASMASPATAPPPSPPPTPPATPPAPPAPPGPTTDESSTP